MNIHEYRFRHRFIEPDLTIRQWELDISIDEQIKEIEKYKGDFDGQTIFEDFAYRYWLYCAACAPIMHLGHEYNDFVELLNNAYAGDIIEIWILNNNPKKFTLNCPNFDGLFPKKGAY